MHYESHTPMHQCLRNYVNSRSTSVHLIVYIAWDISCLVRSIVRWKNMSAFKRKSLWFLLKKVGLQEWSLFEDQQQVRRETRKMGKLFALPLGSDLRAQLFLLFIFYTSRPCWINLELSFVGVQEVKTTKFSLLSGKGI